MTGKMLNKLIERYGNITFKELMEMVQKMENSLNIGVSRESKDSQQIQNV